jgi:single-stranded-DNA-specific exonuclease
MKVKFRPIDLKNNSFEQAVLESHGLNLNWAFADETQILDGLGLRNMDKAVKMLEKHIAKNSTIGILVDSDFDGYSSASIMHRWLKRKNPDLKITFFIQEGKVHGIMPRMFDGVELDFLIIPDAGSAQIEEHYALHSRGWDILILDHHEMGDESPYAVTVNPHNPLCSYPNKSLSGGGVTWKTIAEFDKQCGSEDYKDFLDMVACSIVADVMSTKTMENKAIINLGMKNIVSSYIKANFEADGRLQDKSFDPTTISFYIAPVINAVTRVGTLEEKTMMFEAMAEIGNPMSTIPKLILAKGRQDRAKEKPYIRVLYNLQKQEKEHHKALICTAPVNLARSTTGLVAGQLSGAYNRPVMLLHDREDGVCVGSLRSPNNCNVSDFKGFLEESGLCNWVAG